MTVVILSLFASVSTFANFSKGYPTEGIETSFPNEVYKRQKIKVKVTGESRPRPKVMWVQGDEDQFVATRNEGSQQVRTTGTLQDGKMVPVTTDTPVVDKINTKQYAPDSMQDSNIDPNPFRQEFVKELGLEEVKYLEANSYDEDPIGSDPSYSKGDIFATISTFTGHNYVWDEHYKYSEKLNGDPKYIVSYYTPLSIKYTGYVEETKELIVEENMTLEVGDRKTLTAKVKTIQYDGSETNYIDVSRRETTEWSTNNRNVVSVNPETGQIVAVSEGEARITAKWKNSEDGPYYIYNYADITVGGEDTGCVDCQPEGSCSAPSAAGSMEGAFLDPGVSAVIRADQRGSEMFDVLQGIPTTESLYGNVLALNYLFQNKFVEMTGECTYTIPVTKTYIKTWDEPGPPDPDGNPTTIPMRVPETVSKEYTVIRPYSYWVIDNLEVYDIKEAKLRNYALPNEEITIQPSGYSSPSYATSTGGQHIEEPQYSAVTLPTETVGRDVPNEDFQADAEDAVGKVKVKNDLLQFNGSIIMSNVQTEETGPTPGEIPAPTQIGNNVLYSPGNVIPRTLANEKDTTSSGSIAYNLMVGNINGGSPKNFLINGINTVTVHTPVVDYAVLPDDNRPFDQRMEPDMSRTVLVLDRPFTINFDEKGQHLSIPGYGNRDYQKYTLMKRVVFPFDTYNENKTEFYPQNTWVNIPVGQDSKTFQMPTWVTEGSYRIRTEAWAINSQGQAGCQHNMNGDLNNYCAYEEFEVDAVGRLYGLRVWDIGDFRFENVFRTGSETTNHTGNAYYSGGRDENGVPTSLYGQNSWILPVRPGSHPLEKGTVPRNGYSFLFDFETIGDLWDKGEGVRINPSFSYVSKEGGEQIPVDLYYDSTGYGNKLIKVGSENDVETFTRLYQLSDPMRNINQTELQRAAQYEFHNILSPDQQNSLSWNRFWGNYTTRKTNIGAGYKLDVLNYQSRTLIGPTAIPASVNPTVALRSVQHWYGEYNLPIAPYIVREGTDMEALARQYGGILDGSESEFFKGGYIVVNFEIYTVKNNDQNDYVLGYNAPLANMWEIEGQVSSASDYRGRQFTYNPGDIMLFESDYSVRNDYLANGS